MNASTITDSISTLVRMPTVASRLKEFREAKGLTQSELARAVGMTPQAINLLEAGTSKAPTPENLFAIADVLGVDPRALALGRDAAPPDFDNQIREIIKALPPEPRQEVLDFIHYKLDRTKSLLAQEKMARYITMIDKIKQDMDSKPPIK